MLHSKYVGTTPFLVMPHKYGSNVWNSVMRARNALREGYRFRIGDGKSPLWFNLVLSVNRSFQLISMISTLEYVTMGQTLFPNS